MELLHNLQIMWPATKMFHTSHWQEIVIHSHGKVAHLCLLLLLVYWIQMVARYMTLAVMAAGTVSELFP
jgi:hypothetical protein